MNMSYGDEDMADGYFTNSNLRGKDCLYERSEGLFYFAVHLLASSGPSSTLYPGVYIGVQVRIRRSNSARAGCPRFQCSVSLHIV